MCLPAYVQRFAGPEPLTVNMCSAVQGIRIGVHICQFLIAGGLPCLLAGMNKARLDAVEVSETLACLLEGRPEAESTLGAQLWQMGAVGRLSRLLVTTDGLECPTGDLQSVQDLQSTPGGSAV